MKGKGWGRNQWIFLLLAALGVLLFVLGGIMGGREDIRTDYAGYLEDRVRALCLSIDGVKEAEVFLTLDEAAAVSAGMFGEGGASAYPAVRGVAVVCTGGERPHVRQTVTMLLSAALGIPSNRISVAGVR